MSQVKIIKEFVGIVESVKEMITDPKFIEKAKAKIDAVEQAEGDFRTRHDKALADIAEAVERNKVVSAAEKALAASTKAAAAAQSARGAELDKREAGIKISKETNDDLIARGKELDKQKRDNDKIAELNGAEAKRLADAKAQLDIDVANFEAIKAKAKSFADEIQSN